MQWSYRGRQTRCSCNPQPPNICITREKDHTGGKLIGAGAEFAFRLRGIQKTPWPGDPEGPVGSEAGGFLPRTADRHFIPSFIWIPGIFRGISVTGTWLPATVTDGVFLGVRYHIPVARTLGVLCISFRWAQALQVLCVRSFFLESWIPPAPLLHGWSKVQSLDTQYLWSCKPLGSADQGPREGLRSNICFLW